VEAHRVETSRLPYFLDNRLTDGGKIVSLMRRPTYVFLVVSFLLDFSPSYKHSLSPHSCYVPWPPHPPWLDHSVGKRTSYEAPHYAVFSNLTSLHLSSVLIFSSATWRTRSLYVCSTQEQDGNGFPFLCLLRLAGLRWRYPKLPPHANQVTDSVI
jgi:hypothetical protein